MIQRGPLPIFIIFIFLFVSLLESLYSAQNYSLQEVRKVLKAIETVQSEQAGKDKGSLKKIVITESELNSYIAYRIEEEKEEVMRELQVKLFPENKIEGKILIDLTGQDRPDFIRPRMNFYFGGKIKIRDRRIKLVVKELFLEGQPVQPKILDSAIVIASRIENLKVSSINDWYDLPYGIKDIRTEKGRAIFYY